MTENLPEDGVQSRQAVFVRCCLYNLKQAIYRSDEWLDFFIFEKYVSEINQDHTVTIILPGTFKCPLLPSPPQNNIIYNNQSS